MTTIDRLFEDWVNVNKQILILEKESIEEKNQYIVSSDYGIIKQEYEESKKKSDALFKEYQDEYFKTCRLKTVFESEPYTFSFSKQEQLNGNYDLKNTIEDMIKEMLSKEIE